jgi:hypothetical protein
MNEIKLNADQGQALLRIIQEYVQLQLRVCNELGNTIAAQINMAKTAAKEDQQKEPTK